MPSTDTKHSGHNLMTLVPWTNSRTQFKCPQGSIGIRNGHPFNIKTRPPPITTSYFSLPIISQLAVFQTTSRTPLISATRNAEASVVPNVNGIAPPFVIVYRENKVIGHNQFSFFFFFGKVMYVLIVYETWGGPSFHGDPIWESSD